MKQTTKNKILSYLRQHGECSGTQLENQALEWGTKASVIARRARELAHDGQIERFTGYKRTVQYRVKQPVIYEQAKEVVENEKLFEAPRRLW